MSKDYPVLRDILHAMVKRRAAREREKQLGKFYQWFLTANCCDSRTGHRDPVDEILLDLARGIYVLQHMTDREYVNMRQRRRCFESEVDNIDCHGRNYSAREYKIWEFRHIRKSHSRRLQSVANSLPYIHGYAADRQHFGIWRDYGMVFPVNEKFMMYLPLSKRLALYKTYHAISRNYLACEADRKERAARAAAYPDLLSRIQELEILLATGNPKHDIDS